MQPAFALQTLRAAPRALPQSAPHPPSLRAPNNPFVTSRGHLQNTLKVDQASRTSIDLVAAVVEVCGAALDVVDRKLKGASGRGPPCSVCTMHLGMAESIAP